MGVKKGAMLLLACFLLLAAGCAESGQKSFEEATGGSGTVTGTSAPVSSTEASTPGTAVVSGEAADPGNGAVTGTAGNSGAAGSTKEQAQEELLNLEGKTAEELIELIKNGEELERKSAEAALVDLGAPCTKQVIAAYVNACKIAELKITEEEKEAAERLEKFGSPKNEPEVIWSSLGAVLPKLGTPVIEPLLQAVESGEVSILQYEVQDIIVRIGPPAVEPLITFSGSDQYGVADCAILALGDIGDPRAVSPLIEILKGNGKDQHYDAALSALGQLGEPAVEALISLMKDRKKYANESAQADAAEKLGYIGDVRALEPLIEELDEKDPYRRKAAARGLGEFEDGRVDAIMTQALADKKLEILAGACRYFIRQGDPAAEELLVKALDKYGETDMASDYLNCGNEKLEAAARKWAQDNGYIITSFPGGGGGMEWGSGNQ